MSCLNNDSKYNVWYVVILVIHVAMLGWGGFVHSPVEDEIGHLAAGIQHWQAGWFDLYRVNPPLVRMIAAIPVITSTEFPENERSDLILVGREEFRVGAELTRLNGERSFWLFTLARWACIPFSLLGAHICFRWSNELYGGVAGLLSLVLWCSCPNVIAHGQLLTPDIGATAVGIAAAYSFWRWLKASSWSTALIAGATLGLAQLTKMTWIVLFVLWPILWLCWQFLGPQKLSWRMLGRQLVQLAAVLVLAVQLINLGYGFEGSFRRLREFTFLSRGLSGKHPPLPTSLLQSGGSDSMGNRFVNTWIGNLPIPLPRNYVQGIDRQKWDFERLHWSYLRGQWRTKGWWYYYLYALAIKVPLGTWMLVCVAALVGSYQCAYSAGWRDRLVLLSPPVVVLTLVSSQTGFNHHCRYILPAFPFIFIWVSQLAQAEVLRRGKNAFVLVGALSWTICSSLWVYPHSLAYFNELVVGPKHGQAHLLNSNIDWGQDLLYLKRWLIKRPDVQPIGLAYYLDVGMPYTLVDPKTAGIDYTVPARGPYLGDDNSEQVGPLPGWYAVSVNLVHSQTNRYSYFKRFQPVDVVGYSIVIFHITLPEANRVRKELGLSELPGI